MPRNYQLKSLPSRISYSSIQIPGSNGTVTTIPRREYFDIKVQQMSEERSSWDSAEETLSTSDITPNSYEGGFKTWECSVDLATYLSANLSHHNCFEGEYHIVEVIHTNLCLYPSLTDSCTIGRRRLSSSELVMFPFPSQVPIFKELSLPIPRRLQRNSLGACHCTQPSPHMVLCSFFGGARARRRSRYNFNLCGKLHQRSGSQQCSYFIDFGNLESNVQ